MWKIEKFGKSLKSWKFGIILKNIFYRGKMKSGKILKNMLEFGGKWKNLVKSVKNSKSLVKVWKVGKAGIILKNIFYRGKRKIEKFLKNMLEFRGKLKNLVKICVKSVKNLVKVWKVKNLELFWKIFFTAEKWKVENSWKIC